MKRFMLPHCYYLSSCDSNKRGVSLYGENLKTLLKGIQFKLNK